MRSGLGRLRKPKAAPEPDEPPFYRVLRATIAATPSVKRIALLPAQGGGPTMVWLKETLPEAEVHVFRPRLTPSQLHVRMAMEGRFDLVVDTSIGKNRYLRARDLLMFTTTGGAVLVRALPPKVRASARKKRSGADRRELAQLLAGVGHAFVIRSYAKVSRLVSDPERLGLVIASADVIDGHVVARPRREVLAKIREEEIDEILASKGPTWGRVHRRLEPLEFEAKGQVQQSENEFAKPVARSYSVPALSLREYHDALCAPGQVAIKDNLILPDTFRHNQHLRISNIYLTEVAPSFAYLERDDIDERLEGDYFYLDSEFRGHFGHMLTEVLSRLWAWREAKEAMPNLKALMFMNKNRHLAEFEVKLFAAAGIDHDDIVFRYQPARVERLWAATPMFSHPAYAHPQLAQLWANVGDQLALGAPKDQELPRRFFVSRRIAKRPCHNQQEVEELFAAHGFTVLFPEDYALEAQVELFRSAEVIAGFAGSGLFNLAFSKTPKHVIIVCSESYNATNEHMMAAVVGHRLDVAWLRSDGVRNPFGGWRRGSFHAGYTYEADSPGGRFLNEVLASLDG